MTLKSISKIIIYLMHRCIRWVEFKIYGETHMKYLHVKCAIFSGFLVLVFISINSYVMVSKGLSPLNAVYVTFQTYTTIGFGDIPFKKHLTEMTPLNSVLLLITNMVGMSLMATLINSLISFQGGRTYDHATKYKHRPSQVLDHAHVRNLLIGDKIPLSPSFSRVEV